MRNGDESTGGGRITRVCWMWERVASVQPPPPEPPSLNVKCLTGRLLEEGLQRTEAPLEPGGGGGLWLPAWVLVSHCHSAKTGTALQQTATFLPTGCSLNSPRRQQMLLVPFLFTDGFKPLQRIGGDSARTSAPVFHMMGCLRLFRGKRGKKGNKFSFDGSTAHYTL